MSSQITPEELAQWNDSKQPAIYGVCAVMLALGNTAVPLRIWAQWKIHRRTFMEDYFLISALLFTNIVTITTMVAASKGLGLHTWRVVADDPTYNDLVAMFSCVWVTALCTGPSLFSIKVALLTYYRRLFIVNQVWLRLFWWMNLAFATIWGIGATLFYILQCSPVSYYWERGNPTSGATGKCSDSAPPAVVSIPQITSTISDFFILLLPIMTILGLNMDLKRKLGLMAVFSVGFISFGLSVARVTVAMTQTEMADDDTWTLTAFEVISVAELTSAILCVSAVPIFSYLRLCIRGSSQVSHKSYDSYGFKNIASPRRRDEHTTLASTSSEHLREDYPAKDKLNV